MRNKAYRAILTTVTALIILSTLSYALYRLTVFNEAAPQSNKGVPIINAQAQILAVGDIASCQYDRDEKTAELAKSLTGRILTLGDNVYDSGSTEEFNDCFEPSWGRLKNRIHPSPGNHDYATKDAVGYFGYFGDVAAPGVGYYSFEYGNWLILSLNSNCKDVECDEGSEQVAWVKDQLSKTSTACQAAYYHHPRFSSGAHGNTDYMSDIWSELVDGGADIALSGHDHMYERFAKLDKNGSPSDVGVRNFVVGTGGKDFYKFKTILPGSEVRDNQNNGLLKISLETDKYSWEFINTDKEVIDSGSDVCS